MPVTFIQPGRFTFSPLSVSGCVLWLDASDGTSFTFGTGTLVAQWNDKSGNSIHLSQATSSKQPSRSGTQNGHTVVTCDGGDVLASASNLSLGTFTIFIVAKVATGTAGYLYAHGTSSGSAEGSYCYTTSSDSISARRTGPSVSGKNGTANPWFTRDVWHIFRHVYDGTHAGHAMYVDGVPVTLNNGSGTADPGTGTASKSMTLGGVSGDEFPLPNGSAYGEVIAYNSALDPSDCAEVEDYLSHKWGTQTFTPESLSNLVDWWDADHDASFTFGTGSLVASWAGRVNSHTVAQGTGSAQPNRNATINGLDAVAWDDSNDSLALAAASLTVAQPLTIAAVIKLNSGGDQGVVVDSDSAVQCAAYVDVNNYRTAAGSGPIAGGTTDASTHLVVWVFNGASSAIYVDGSSVASGNIGSNSLTGLRFGHIRSGLGDIVTFGGALGAVIITSSVMGSSDRDALRIWSQATWGTA